jgi:hypothetical protein
MQAAGLAQLGALFAPVAVPLGAGSETGVLAAQLFDQDVGGTPRRAKWRIQHQPVPLAASL